MLFSELPPGEEGTSDVQLANHRGGTEAVGQAALLEVGEERAVILLHQMALGLEFLVIQHV